MKLITTHKGTDFDALASLIAGTIIYPDAVPVLPTSPNPNVKRFLALHKELFQLLSPKEIDFPSVTHLIVVDTNNWSRLDHGKALKDRTDLAITLWDHHEGGNNISAGERHVRKTGAAVTQLIEVIREQALPLSPIQATLFLAGIYEDTGGLFFPSTTAADVYAAGFLLENQADLTIVSSFLEPAYNADQKDILFQMIKSAQRTKINSYTISCNIVPIEGHVGNLSVVVHMYREILNVNAAFGIFHEKKRDVCIVIGRSNTDELNMGGILRCLGGGGHPGAGSALVKSMDPESIRNKLLEQVQSGHHTASLLDLMSYPVSSVAPDMPMQTVAGLLREKGFSGLPVMEDGKLVGVISRRDFRKLKKEKQIQAPVKAFMSRDRIVTISASGTPIEAANLIVKHDIGRLPVIENGEVIGIITRTDVMRYFYDLMPE